MPTELPSTADGSVGAQLLRLRKRRRISQLDLAAQAGVSNRHLSFIETGRARPSRAMVLRLGSVLGLGPREQNELLLLAGFAPVHRETPLDAPEMAPLLEALRLILSRSEPFGAVALDRRWDIVMASAAYAGGLNELRVPGTAPVAPYQLTAPPRPNMLRVLCHPDGSRRHLVNWSSVVRAVIARVARDPLATRDPAHQRLLQEVTAYEGVPALDSEADGNTLPLVVPIELRREGRLVRLLSTIATLGTAEDITLRELRIEMFFPADAETEALARAGSEPAAGRSSPGATRGSP